MEHSEFWAQQRVLITGGNGLLGRHVADELDRLGAGKVYMPSHDKYDLKSRTETSQLFYDCQATMVIHCAAHVGGIGYNQKHPVELLHDNLLINENVLMYARAFNVKKFVGIGSVCAYPKHTPLPFRESDLWNGYPDESNAPYGLAKRMLLAQSQAYRAQYGYNAIHLILANLYGPGDCFDEGRSHVIPAIIHKMVEAKRDNLPTVTLFGDGTPTRDFLYVEDAAKAICLAAEKYDSGEPVNIGTGFEVSIDKVANRIQEFIGYEGEIIWDTSKPNGQPRRVLDCSRAKEHLDWEAEIRMYAGLHKTIHWYLEQSIPKVVIG